MFHAENRLLNVLFREILSCQILQHTMDSLGDPDNVNLFIVLWLGEGTAPTTPISPNDHDVPMLKNFTHHCPPKPFQTVNLAFITSPNFRIAVTFRIILLNCRAVPPSFSFFDFKKSPTSVLADAVFEARGIAKVPSVLLRSRYSLSNPLRKKNWCAHEIVISRRVQ